VTSARRDESQAGVYAVLVKWLVKAFGYFEDYAVPGFSPMERAEYAKVMGLARPFLASIDETTRTYFIPAVDAAQTLDVIDGGGRFSALPDGQVLQPPVALPRLGMALELKDSRAFVVAIERYVAAVRTLLDRIRVAYPSRIPPDFAIPSPQTKAVAGGTLYYYPLPWNLGPDAFPCALLADDLLVLSTSSALADEMVKIVPMPAAEVVDSARAACAAVTVDFDEGFRLLARLGNAVFQHMHGRGLIGHGDMQGAMMVKMHLDAVLRSARAFRGYRCVTCRVDGRVMTHSWLHVEDIDE
jgi:hypothetical protein